MTTLTSSLSKGPTTGRFARSYTRRFVSTAPAVKKKNLFFHKFLVLIGLREEEEEIITDEEKLRRYTIAMQGWKKVKKTLTIIRYRGADHFQSKALPTTKTSFFAYSNLVIAPNTKFAFFWKTLKALMVTYNLLIVPYRVSFDNFAHFLTVIDYVMDAVFVVDIILNFFFAFNRRTKIVKDFKSIAIHYILTQLWVDLISIFPYYWLNDPRQSYFLRYFRYLQSFKSQEQLKAFYESILLLITSNINIVKSLSRILNFTVFLAIIGNLLASIWFSLGRRTNVNVGDDSPHLIDGWVNTLEPGADGLTLYIASLYWTFATLSTLGYGDIVGFTTEEYIYTMLVEFIGVFLFAYMMSNINSLIEKLDDDHVEILENKSEELDQWILKIDRSNRDRKLPTDLVEEIKSFYRNYWQKDHTMIQNDEFFLNQMPRDLRSKLIRHLFHKFIDRFSVFFEGTEEAFIDEIVINLVPRTFSKDTDIIKIDHGTKYVYFVLKGKVTVCSQDAVEKYLILDHNTYFGEHLIFFNLKSSNAFRACDDDVECMCLPKSKFVELCEEFPVSAKILKYKAYLRRKQFRKAKLEVQAANNKKMSPQKTWKLDLCKLDEDAKQKEEDAEAQGEVEGEGEKESNNFLEKIPLAESQEDQNDQVDGNQFLEHAKKLKNTLDRIEKQINSVESDLTKKLKNIKYYIGYISSIEDFLPTVTA